MEFKHNIACLIDFKNLMPGHLEPTVDGHQGHRRAGGPVPTLQSSHRKHNFMEESFWFLLNSNS